MQQQYFVAGEILLTRKYICIYWICAIMHSQFYSLLERKLFAYVYKHFTTCLVRIWYSNLKEFVENYFVKIGSHHDKWWIEQGNYKCTVQW